MLKCNAWHLVWFVLSASSFLSYLVLFWFAVCVVVVLVSLGFIPFLLHPIVLQDFWNHVRGEEFTQDLDLSQPERTVPLAFHCDGVKIYKNQKIWVYSYSSLVRKSGNAIENKAVLAVVRDSMLAKPHTHDALGRLIGWICRTLGTGKYPVTDYDGSEWPQGSAEALRAGQDFTCNKWRLVFAAFKGDLEARVQVHKLVRNYMSNNICEHCCAGKLISYCDFRKTAPWTEVRFDHNTFLELNPAHRQSSWMTVPGWRKERNLED